MTLSLSRVLSTVQGVSSASSLTLRGPARKTYTPLCKRKGLRVSNSHQGAAFLTAEFNSQHFKCQAWVHH